MTLTIHDDGRQFLVQLLGSVSWNDRLQLSGLARHLRASRAGAVVLDGTRADEADLGAFEGLAATTRRMALLEGRDATILRPARREAA